MLCVLSKKYRKGSYRSGPGSWLFIHSRAALFIASFVCVPTVCCCTTDKPREHEKHGRQLTVNPPPVILRVDTFGSGGKRHQIRKLKMLVQCFETSRPSSVIVLTVLL